MSERYQVVTPFGSQANLDSKKIAELLAKDGQLVLPLLDLLVTAQASLDQLIDVMGRATIEAVLKMSAEQVAELGFTSVQRVDQALLSSIFEEALRYCETRPYEFV